MGDYRIEESTKPKNADGNQESQKTAVTLIGVLVITITPNVLGRVCAAGCVVLVWCCVAFFQNGKKLPTVAKSLSVVALICIFSLPLAKIYDSIARVPKPPTNGQAKLLAYLRKSDTKQVDKAKSIELPNITGGLNFEFCALDETGKSLTLNDDGSLRTDWRPHGSLAIEKGCKVENCYLERLDEINAGPTDKVNKIETSNQVIQCEAKPLAEGRYEISAPVDCPKLVVGRYSIGFDVTRPGEDRAQHLNWRFVTRRRATALTSQSLKSCLDANSTGLSSQRIDGALQNNSTKTSGGWFWDSDIPYGRKGSYAARLHLSELNRDSVILATGLSDTIIKFFVKGDEIHLEAMFKGMNIVEMLDPIKFPVAKIKSRTADVLFSISVDGATVLVTTRSNAGVRSATFGLPRRLPLTFEPQVCSISGTACKFDIVSVTEETYSNSGVFLTLDPKLF